MTGGFGEIVELRCELEKNGHVPTHIRLGRMQMEAVCLAFGEGYQTESRPVKLDGLRIIEANVDDMIQVLAVEC